jgi:hypothetical protein
MKGLSRYITTAAVVGAIVALLSGCRRRGTAEGTGEVVARVDDAVITRAELDGGAPYPAAIVDAAFGLGPVGSVSAPIAVDGTYRVLALTGRRPAVRHSLSEVKGQVRQRLVAERQKLAVGQLVEKLQRSVEHRGAPPGRPGWPIAKPLIATALRTSQVPGQNNPAV